MNGNTQFGTATPNGNVNVDGWMDSTASDTLFSAGALKGFAVTPTSTTGLSLNVGGTAGVNDVAIAKNVAGDTARIAGHASTPYVLTLPGAPGTSGQSKVFSIVAFIDTTVTAMTQNGVDTVGVTYVAGTAAATGSQVPPTDAQIRSAIPNGQTAFISVVANVTLAYGATAIVAGNIVGRNATIPGSAISSLLASRVIMPSASNGGADLGTAYTRNFNAPYLQYGVLTRIGNVVHLSVSYNGNGVSAGAGTSHPAESIPYGYRPTTSQRVVGVLSTSSLTGTWLWKINGATTGTGPATTDALITSAGFGAGQNEVYGSAFWITADPITPVLGDAKIVLG